MKQLRKLRALAGLALALALTACEKEGPIGPEGPQGPQGEQGVQGSKGDKGTANVIYSQWDYLKYPIRDTIIDGSHMKVSEILAPKLTENIMESGLIMVYMRFGATVYALPYISDAGGKPSEINFRSRAGKIFITRFAFDDSGSINIGGSLQFRYILIPGGVAAQVRDSGLGLNTYSEVANAFEIPE
ncbi:MAG TPA: hypothetical protein VIR29_05190 [Anseongella sp.]